MATRISDSEAQKVMLAANLQPLEEFKGGDYPWLCVCLVCNREVSPRFRSVRDRGSGCKYCSGNSVMPSEAQEEMKQNGLKPLSEFPGANKPWKSECMKCGSKTSPRLSDLRIGHSGCKKCADRIGGLKRRLDKSPHRAGKRTNFEDVLLAMKNSDLEPLEPYKTSTAPWKCKCLKCGEIVTPTYGQIKQGSGGCKKCYLESKIGVGRLDNDSAVLVMKGKNLIPLEPYPGAMVPWKCKCLDCGSFVNPRYAHIQQGRKGCKVCGYKKNADIKRTTQDEAFSVARAAGFEPLEPYRGRHLPWKCKCMKCGKEIAPHYSGIVTGGGCRYCAGLVVDPNEATKVMKKAKLSPLVPYPGAGKPWACKCLKCGKNVKPRYAQINVGIGGCKYCATHGYDFSKGGILYLITHEAMNAHKIGITNEGSKEKRLEKHLKQGWQTYRTQFYVDGNRAFEIEQEILTWWRNDLGLPTYLSSSEMPQGGFTETVDADEIDLSAIWDYIESVSKKLDGRKSLSENLKTSMPRKQRK